MPPKRTVKTLPEITTPFSRLLAQLERTYQETVSTTSAQWNVALASEEARVALLDRQRRALETLALEYPDEEDISRLRRAAQLMSLIEFLKAR